MTKHVYFFGLDDASEKNLSEGNMGMKVLLGGKGANLAEMANLHMPVPQGFTISTEACVLYEEAQAHPERASASCKQAYGVSIDKHVAEQVEQQLITLQQATQSVFPTSTSEWDAKQKMLLLSVRSGAQVSMPGMMDTILSML